MPDNTVLLNFHKVCSSVKNDLESGLKNPKNLLENIFNLIDMCREATPVYFENHPALQMLGEAKYFKKVDPPLTDEEKESYRNKVKIESLT